MWTLRCLAIICLGAFLSALVFRSYSTSRGIPCLSFDAAVFLPQTVPFQVNGTLVNSVWRGAALIDKPEGGGRMICHGFLYSVLVSSIMWKADYPTMLKVLGILHGISAAFFLAFLWIFARRWKKKVGAIAIGWMTLLAAVNANYTQGNLGRPETLVALFVMVGVALMSILPLAWHAVAAGVFTGVIGAAHPVAGVFSGLGFGIYAAWRFPPARWMREVAIAAGITMACFLLCFLWYPYSLAEWLDGNWRMGRAALNRGGSIEARVQQWTSSSGTFFLAGVFLLILWTAFRTLGRCRQQGVRPSSGKLFYLQLLVALVGVYRFCIHVSWTRYNILPFIPLGLLLVFHETFETRLQQDRLPRFWRIASLSILGIAAVGFAADIYQRVHSYRYGMALPEARQRLAALRASYPDKTIALNEHQFTLTEDFTNIVFINHEAGITEPLKKAAIIVFSQAFSGDLKPRDFRGFRLEEDFFDPRRPSLFGIPVAKQDTSQCFAVYVKVKEDGTSVE